MKTFLLIVTILFLISRVSSTPRGLSKKVYEKHIEKETKSMADNFAKKTEDEIESFKFGVYILSFIFTTLMICYYLYIGSIFSNKILYFMSTIQASTALVHFWKDITGNPLSTNPEEYKFNRWWVLFNVVLDYVYYPITIYMLLQ